MNPTFRNGLYAGLLVAAAIGIYLLQLWAPERQVELHSAHLLEAIEESDSSALAHFIAETYEDQWGHDRAAVVSRLRKIARYLQDSQIEARDARVDAAGTGRWSARITVIADRNEASAFLAERVDNLPEPFNLQWRRQSWKPWDWKLVRVTNPSFELPPAAGL